MEIRSAQRAGNAASRASVPLDPAFAELQRPAFLTKEDIFLELERIMKLPAAERGPAVNGLVDVRFDYLVEHADKHRSISLISNTVVTSFVHPETEIMPMALFAGYTQDDKTVYVELLNAIISYKESGPHYTFHNIVPTAVGQATATYFGGYVGNEQDRAEIVVENSVIDIDNDATKDFSIADFKGKGVAVCLERATTAHNMMLFMGYKSTLITTPNFMVGEKDEATGHAYLVVEGETKTVIYDPTILPHKVVDGTTYCVPGIYHITQEDKEELTKGGYVNVTLRMERMEGHDVVTDEIKLRYGSRREAY